MKLTEFRKFIRNEVANVIREVSVEGYVDRYHKASQKFENAPAGSNAARSSQKALNFWHGRATSASKKTYESRNKLYKGLTETEDMNDWETDRNWDAPVPKKSKKQSRCADCGKVGEMTGHQDCPSPQNHESVKPRSVKPKNEVSKRNKELNKRDAEQAQGLKQFDAERKIHPKTGEKAPEGKHWAENIMSGKYTLESDGTPWTLSVSSETYWSS